MNTKMTRNIKITASANPGHSSSDMLTKVQGSPKHARSISRGSSSLVRKVLLMMVAMLFLARTTYADEFSNWRNCWRVCPGDIHDYGPDDRSVSESSVLDWGQHYASQGDTDDGTDLIKRLDAEAVPPCQQRARQQAGGTFGG